MDIWSVISSIAKQILGDQAPSPVNLSQLEKTLLPRSPDFLPQSKKSSPPKNEIDPIEVIPQYQFVLEAIKNKCPAIFVTGKAGTGKSTLIRFITENSPNCVVVAPTAIAAVNVNGSTIHSFFQFPLKTLNPEELHKPRKMILPVIKSMEVLVIDEISMVPPEIIDCINNSLKYTRNNDRPFGGVSVVFAGDLLQLPPVEDDEVVAAFHTDRYRSPYFFSADVFQSAPILPVVLTRVFRQSEQDFIDLLDRIRLNQDHREAVAKFNRDCFRDRIPNPNDRSLFLVSTRKTAASINERNLSRIVEPLHTFKAIVSGKFQIQHNRFQAPHVLDLKRGAQVLFVKNKRPYWLNGTLGKIEFIGNDYIGVKLASSGNIVNVEREVWEKIEYRYDQIQKKITSEVVGKYEQFPLALGWAITIHKSQGMTLDSVRIDLGSGGAFCAGQTYVALSRCRTMGGIRLDRPISMKDVKANAMLLDFYKSISTI